MRVFFLSLIHVLFSTIALVAQSSLDFTSEDVSYREGTELLSAGKYLSARKAFENYLEHATDEVKIADARYFIAYSAMQLKNRNGEALIEDFIRDYPNHTKSSLAYYELGSLKYAEKNYPAAIKYFEKLYMDRLGKDVKYEAKFKLGYAYFTQQEFDKAYEMFNELKREPNKYQYPASYYAGYLNFEKGEYDRAFYDFSNAEKSEAYVPVIPSMLVKVYYKQKRYDELIPYGLASLNKNSLKDKSEINLYLGEAYFQKNDYANASKYYDAYLASKSNNADPDLLFRIAYVQMESGDNNSAIESFKKVALKNDTLGYISSYYLGKLYTQTNNKNYALSAFKISKDHSYDPELEEESLFQYAKLNLDLTNFDEAIKTINEYKLKYPGNPRTDHIDELLSEAYLNSRNYDMALKHIETMQNPSPRIKKAYQQIAFFKGTELFNDEQFADAVDMFNKSLQQPMAPEFVIKSNYWKGEAYSIGLKYEDAVQAYAGVFRADSKRISPEYLDTRYGIGYAYYNLKEYDKALDHFNYYVDNLPVTARDVKFKDALVRLGDCYYVTKQYSKALDVFDEAIRNNKAQADYSYFRKGMVYGIMGNIEAANKTFDILISDYPRSRHIANALYQKGRLNFENGSYTFAIDIFNKLIRNYPESTYLPYALQSHAIASVNMKNYSAAENDYKTILAKYPTHEVANDALLGLQEVLLQTGKSDEFDGYMGIFRDANPKSDQLESIEFEAAKSQYFNQQYAQAIKSLERYLDSYPNTGQRVESRYLIADAYARIDQQQKALESYYMIADEISFNKYTRVMQRIAELEYAMNNFDTAIEYFLKLEKIAASKKDEFSAWSGLMKSYFNIGDNAQAINYGKWIIEKGQVAPNAKNEALLLIAKASLAMGDNKQGREYLDLTVETAKDENGAEALYLTAEILYNNQLHQESIDKLFQLNSNYSIYEYWLGKSFLLIADNYLAMGEDFQAKATLQSVIDNSPNKEVIDQARLKLMTLDEKAREMENSTLDTLEIEDVQNR